MTTVESPATFEVVPESRLGELHQQLLALGTGTSVGSVLTMLERGDVTPTSISEIEALGSFLGWPDDALLEHVLTGPLAAYRMSLIAPLSGFSAYVGRNADKWSASLSKPTPDHRGIWYVLSSLGPEVLELLAEAMCIAATRTPAAVASVARDLLPRLPTALALEHLQRIATSGRAPQRAKAIDAMADIADGADRAGLIDWVDSQLGHDQSGGVQKAVARLKSMSSHEETPKPALPTVDLPEISGFDAAAVEALAGIDEWSTRRQDLEGFLRVVNGSDARQVGWYAVATLARLADRTPSSLSELNRFHVARALLANRQPDHRSLPSLTALADLLGVPSPMELRAVAEVDSGTELGLVELVAAVHAAHPESWSSQAITDFVVFHEVAFAKLIGPWNGNHFFDRLSFVRLIEAAETLPEKLKEAIVVAAIGRRRSDREVLLRIVDAHWCDRVIPFLADGSSAKRTGAAEWIAHHRPAGAAAPLREAIEREGSQKAKAAMLDALEALGEGLDELLDLATLLAEATTAMAKKNAKPSSIGWLDFDTLPPLTWTDGSPVPPVLVQWFVVSSVKADRPQPSPILRAQFANMEPESTHRFGETLLDIWLAEDERRPIIDSRGLLALVAAAGGPDLAAPALAYIRKHRGNRKAQATALLRMLAWVDEPAATQAVMSIADHFPTKFLHREAKHQAELLAARRGLTVEALADLSVPDGGFDSDGRKTLDFGQRRFTVHLNDDLTIRLLNDGTGKTVRSLPAAHSGECAEHVKSLKRGLTSLKKELKRTQAMQPLRLRAAMISGRTWSVGEFERSFVAQPIMRRLASRLVWRASEDDHVVTFRPLSDGSLVGPDDGDVELVPNTRVSLAHERLLGDETSSQWQAHLADYEVTPLFEQFARPVVSIRPGQTVIEDFVGFRHTDATVRRVIRQVYWTLGSTEETGLVCELVKDVPGTNLTAVTEIFGGLHPAVVESLECFLGGMYFVPTGEPPWDRANVVELSSVPAVALVELYADGEAMARAGSGYEPNYEQKICG